MHLPRAYCILLNSRLWEFQRPYSWPSDSGSGWQIMGNYLLVCPRCGEVWARLWSPDLPPDSIRWEIYTQLCARHPATHYNTFPGSLFPGWWGYEGMRDRALFDHLPLELLQRELKLHLRRSATNDDQY